MMVPGHAEVLASKDVPPGGRNKKRSLEQEEEAMEKVSATE